MQGMKPSYLTMRDIRLNKYSHSVKTYPTLHESGIDHLKKWILTPNLPNSLLLIAQLGSFSQIKVVTNYLIQTFELTVTNHYMVLLMLRLRLMQPHNVSTTE